MARRRVRSCMVGATGDFERALPVLQAFGKRIVHMGPLGSGDSMKAVNNTLLGANILALAESLTALVKAGVNPRVAVETLNASSGRSFVSEALVPDRVLTGAWPRTFRLASSTRDVGSVSECRGVLPRRSQENRRAAHAARAALGEEADTSTDSAQEASAWAAKSRWGGRACPRQGIASSAT